MSRYFLRNRDGLKACQSGPVQHIACHYESVTFEELLSQGFEVQEAQFREGDSDKPLEEPRSDSLQRTRGTTAAPSPLKRDRELEEAEEDSCELLNKPNRNKRRRKQKRINTIQEQGHVPRQPVKERIIMESKTFQAAVNLAKLPTTSCGYQARYRKINNDGTPDILTLEEAVRQGYQVVPWNGRDAMPLVNPDGTVWGVLAGQPETRTSETPIQTSSNKEKQKSYKDCCESVYQMMIKVGQMPEMQEDVKKNRRGDFPVINIGVTHGKGTLRPINLHTYKSNGESNKYTEVTDDILANKSLQRLASWQSYCYRFWCPEVYDDYLTNLSELYKKLPDLRQNFTGSIFPCCALNCGTNVWTKLHRDSMNRANGWCAITALGRFDATKGGHLLLPDLKLAIEFPSGSVILIPSATVTHGNIPVQDGDKRASFTQFAAGGLFRFIDNHFMTEKELKKKDKPWYNQIMAEKSLRWRSGLQMFSKMSDFFAEI